VIMMLAIGKYTRSCISITSKPKPTASQKPLIPTLAHLSATDKIRDWKATEYNYKLNLCIAFALIANENQRIKLTAKDFYVCIETATTGLDSTNEMRIVDVPDGCLVLMKKY